MSARDAAEFIPVCRPSIGEEEIAEVVATLRSGWLSTGRRTAAFEQAFGRRVEARHALATSSCTAALELALAGLGVGRGDQVITSPLTFCSTVNTILRLGAEPVVADVDEDGNLDPRAVEQAWSGRTRAIVPVHLAGLPCRLEELRGLARERGAWVVEDAAHAVGAAYRGAPIGVQRPASEGLPAREQSDAVAFSFYAGKNMTTGEGGMLTAADDALAERVRCLRLHGISKDAWARYSDSGSWSYEVLEPGFKSNMSDIQASLGLHQLRKLDRFNQIRREHALGYSEGLADLDEVETPRERPESDHAWHLYSLRLRLENLEIDRAEWIRRLRERNVGAAVHFIPIPLHRAYRDLPGLEAERCPRALALYPRLVSLPLYSEMTVEQRDRVVRAVRDICRRARRRGAA